MEKMSATDCGSSSIGPTLPPKSRNWAELAARQGLLILTPGPASRTAAARVKEHLHTGTAALFDTRYPGGQVYNQPFAAHDIGTLSQHDIALQSDRIARHVIDRAVALRGLLLLRDDDIALGFQPADALA